MEGIRKKDKKRLIDVTEKAFLEQDFAVFYTFFDGDKRKHGRKKFGKRRRGSMHKSARRRRKDKTKSKRRGRTQEIGRASCRERVSSPV